MTYAFTHAFEEMEVGGDLYDGEAWIASDEDGWAVHSFAFTGGGEMLSGHRAFEAFANAFETLCGDDVQAICDERFGKPEHPNNEHRLSAVQLGLIRSH